MLGRLTLNTSKTSSSLLNSIGNSIKGEVNDLVADITRKLNIHDFYSAHLLDYCEVSRQCAGSADGSYAYQFYF